MTNQTAATGVELYYIDVAAESYEMPPPIIPQAPSTITSDASLINFYLFSYVYYLLVTLL